MAKQARAIQTRRMILEAAGAVFDEFGYESATIAEILARAGVTKGALYFHFASKEELARGVLGEALTTEGVLPQESRLQEWVDIGMVLAHRLPKEPLLSASIRLSADRKARDLFGTSWEGWIDFIAAQLAAAKDQGELLPHVDVRQGANLFVGAWTGIEIVSTALEDGESLESKIAGLYDYFLPAIAVPGALRGLDTAPDRGARVWEVYRTRQAEEPGEATAVMGGK
ncbi:gamma-butyrolactone-binding protein [Streptomyces eurocidicus]|uniref:AcrR family transcriptional regulator n=1 Tax=Streptomyces eurocidicus TaxID=66423 RepID=A0A2N8NT89_STREU|nr:ScbR family autoregulator-binding transcription factor [Streptomyces eurocidicus]MBB5123132.1 AcrR family transcriptional regulator [Streptomyces eurocidicus]MBF6055476.1 TetR family transcriptional regulator [Streptomyces eurocidicus]PNE31983.1 gamma-butyrolactone-binding protein [Streptomyces eurocidicus]